MPLYDLIPVCVFSFSFTIGPHLSLICSGSSQFNAFLYRTQGQQCRFHLSDIPHVCRQTSTKVMRWCERQSAQRCNACPRTHMWGTYSDPESESQNQWKLCCMNSSCFVLRPNAGPGRPSHTSLFLNRTSQMLPNFAAWGLFTQTSICVFP